MQEMSSITCPHCGVVNPNPGNFCTSCGLALPSVAPTGPRIVSGKVIASTVAGQKLQSGELLNTTKLAARSLLSIGVINLAFGAFYVFLIVGLTGASLTSSTLSRVSPWFMASTISMLVSGALYLAMYWWANYNPLAATLVGLVIYLLRWGADLYFQETLRHGSMANQNTNYGYVRIFMVFYLLRGVAAGWKHRQLEKQQLISNQPIRAIPID